MPNSEPTICVPQLIRPSYAESVSNGASDFCSWLKAAELNMLFCYNPSSKRFIQHCVHSEQLRPNHSPVTASIKRFRNTQTSQSDIINQSCSQSYRDHIFFLILIFYVNLSQLPALYTSSSIDVKWDKNTTKSKVNQKKLLRQQSITTLWCYIKILQLGLSLMNWYCNRLQQRQKK